MKKLMIVAAIVCAAVVSQGASLKWGLTSKNTILNQAGNSAGGYTVYLMNSADANWSNTLTGLANGTITATTIASAAGYMHQGTLGESGAATGKLSESVATVTDPGVTYDKLVFVAFDKQSGTDYYYLSDVKTGSSYDGSDTYPSGTKAAWGSTDYAQSNWKAVSAVPEPTSGILLLLGVAGIALRRRRA